MLVYYLCGCYDSQYVNLGIKTTKQEFKAAGHDMCVPGKHE